MVRPEGPRRMPVILSSYRLGPGQRASYKTVPPPWDWLPWRQTELGPWRSKSRIIFTVLVPPPLVSVKRLALIVTACLLIQSHFFGSDFTQCDKRSLHCFEYFFVCLVLIGLEIKFLYNKSYVVSTVRYTEVRLYCFYKEVFSVLSTVFKLLS